MKSSSVVKAVAVAVALLVSGCDFEEKLSLRKLEEDIMKQEPVVKDVEPAESMSKSQTKKECASLEHFIATRIKMLESARAENDILVADINSDRRKLSERIGEIADKNFEKKTGSREMTLLMFLKDADINALAVKYLDGDFVMVRGEFEEKVRHAVEMERQKNEALAQNKAMFDSIEANAKLKLDQTQKNIMEKEAQRKRDIANAEKRLRNLRTGTGLGRKDVKREQEIMRVERELAALKDFSSLERQKEQARNASRNSEAAQQKAIQERTRAANNILLRHKDDVSAFQLAEEYEKKTVVRLSETMKNVDISAREQKKLLSKRLLFLSSISNGLDRLDLSGLKTVRAEIYRELAIPEEGAAK